MNSPPPKDGLQAPKRGRGRPRTGQLTQYTGGRLGARVTRDIDGESVRKRVKLETRDGGAAQKKIERLAKNPTAPVAIAHSDETFAEAAERLDPERSRKIVRGHEELGKLKLHAFPIIGALPVTAVTTDHIETVLDAVMQKGRDQQTVKHVLNAMNAVFKHIKRDKTLPYRLGANPVLAATMPEFAKRLKKVTMALEDHELGVYLRWRHPVERFQVAVLQRQVMSVIGRCFGGERTGDFHANAWEDFDVDGGAFRSGWAPRQKTGLPQRLDVPEPMRPILRAYWEAQGRPMTGPLFPVLRGDRTGEGREGGSHADAFRRDLQRAFGIYEWRELPRPSGKPGRGAPRLGWVKAREMTGRERELFLPGKYTEPVDFHSWRRSFAIGMQDAGMGLSHGAALAGAGPETHKLYRRDRGTARQVPAQALPDLSGVAGALFGHSMAENAEGGFPMTLDSETDSATYTRARKDSNLRPSASECDERITKHAITCDRLLTGDGGDEAKTPHENVAGLNWWPQLTLSEDALSDLVSLASKAKRWDLVEALSSQLTGLLDALAAATPPNVASLAAARKRRGDGGGK